MDHVIFYWINGLSSRNAVLDWVGVFLGVYGIYVLAGMVITLVFIKKYSSHALLAIMSALISRGVVVELLKRLVNRPRPYEVLNPNLLVIDMDRGVSFPSGHAVILFAIAFSFYGTKWFWPVFAAAVLGSLARVFIGVHYPADIFVSFVLAFAIVWAVKRWMGQSFQFADFRLK